ncbi:MAG: tetratricopeptide repeat protein [Paracoccaceae bacterium]
MDDKNQIDLILSLFTNGKAQEAIDELEPLIKNRPDDAVLFNISGACYAQLGEPIIAMRKYDKAIELNPKYSEAYNNLGITFQELGEPEKALENFEKAFSLKPEKVEIINVIISILNELNDPKISVEYYQKIINNSPEEHLVHFNLGTVYQDMGRTDDAISSYKQTIKLQPEFSEAFLNLGIIFEETGKLDEALKNLQRANEIDPDNLLILNNLGITLEELDRKEDAIIHFEKAIQIDPDDRASYFNLGVALRDKNKEYAIKNFEKVIELNPKNGECYFHLGELYFENKRHNKALLNFDKAFNINPNIDFLIGSRLYTKMQLALWDDFQEQVNILSDKISNNDNAITPFSLMALIDDPQTQYNATKNYGNFNFPRNATSLPIKPYLNHKKIRIGYFSADFHNHPTMHLMAELFEFHDKSKFETFAFSFGPDLKDQWRERVIKSFDDFIDVRLKSDKEISDLSREIEIDIAVNLGGYTQSSRTGVFANLAAPIQVNFLGFPGTMGVDYIDYIVADNIVIPTENESYFSEKIVHMPETYQINMSKRDVSNKPLSRYDFGLPEASFIFTCFNNIHKITPPTFESWMRILKAVDGSVLWLYANNENVSTNILNSASRLGVDKSRIIFAKHVPVEDHLNRIGMADLFLDTLPYNAHTTGSEALRMGVPVITLIGNSFASRVAASIVTAVDMPELITRTQDEYESLAIELAKNQERFNQIKQKLIENLPTSSLLNSQSFTKNLELAYEKMNALAHSKQLPDHIIVKNLIS